MFGYPILAYPVFALSLVLLVYGGDWLVKGAVGLAERLAIPPLVIGLTIVAFGTSAPELLVSLEAALSGVGDLAIGNVVGSNISNVLMVLGLPAIMSPILFTEPGVKRTLVFLIVTTLVFMWMLSGGVVLRWHGFLLLAILIGFLAMQYQYTRAHKAGNADEAALEDIHDEVGEVPQETRTILFYLIAGLVALPVAAHFTVTTASSIAMQWGVTEAVIGLTIVAIGTSLPELAAGIAAARAGNASVSVGNVIGSNLFNIAAIMGVTASIIPVPVEGHIVSYDMWIMLATTAFLILLPLLKVRITGAIGIAMLLIYALYLFSTVMLG